MDIHFDLKQFVKERNEALLSLDKDKIVAYMKKYDVKVPPDRVFWASVHKAILGINVTMEQKENSKIWLIEHGFKPY